MQPRRLWMLLDPEAFFYGFEVADFEMQRPFGLREI
jgi:hypothetical protein